MVLKFVDRWSRSSWLVPLLLVFCLVDFGYSSYQHYHFPMDGDISSIVLPKKEYQQVLADPLGFSAIFGDEQYAATNRFFCHYTMRTYVNSTTRWLAPYTGLIDSPYWSAAIFKSFVQLLLLLVLAMYVHCWLPVKLKSFVVVLFLLFPFFQAMGFNGIFGIIDHSLTFTFFYAWPFALLLLFYYPFYRSWIRQQPPKIGVLGRVGLGVLAVVLPFSSPIVVPVLLLISLVYGLNVLWRAKGKLADTMKYTNTLTICFLVMITLLALYSFYLGQFNSEQANLAHQLPLWQRYLKMPQGLWSMLTLKVCYPVLLIGLLINWRLLRKSTEIHAEHLQRLFKWALLFFVIYLLLLPLGGYRPYRAFIVRKDTILPIICGLVLLYGTTTLYLLKSLAPQPRLRYALWALAVAVIFTAADGPNFNHNTAEKAGLRTLKETNEVIVPLASDQWVMSWEPLSDYRTSEINARLLLEWGITDTVRLYYNVAE